MDLQSELKAVLDECSVEVPKPNTLSESIRFKARQAMLGNVHEAVSIAQHGTDADLVASVRALLSVEAHLADCDARRLK